MTVFFRAIHTGEPIVIYGDGSSSRDYTHVEDISRALELALERDLPGGTVLHIASGVETTAAELATLCRDAAGAPDHPVEYRPRRPGEVDRNFASYDLAEQMLGYKPSIDREARHPQHLAVVLRARLPRLTHRRMLPLVKPAEETPLSPLRLGELSPRRASPTASSTSSPASARLLARRWPRTPTWTRSRSPARPRSAELIVHAAPGTSRKSRSSWAASRPTSSSPTPTSSGRSRARPRRSSSTRASAAPPAPGCTCTSTCTTRSSTASPTRAEDQARPRPRAGHRDGPAGLRTSSCDRVTGYLRVRPRARAPTRRRRRAAGAATRGYFVQPTVLVDTTPDMRIVREEIFGPVVAAMPFSDLDEIAAAGQRHRLRTGRRHLDLRHLQGPPRRRDSSRPARSGSTATTSSTRPALRRLQAVRLGPRDGPRGPGGLHRGQGRHHPALTRAAPGQ